MTVLKIATWNVNSLRARLDHVVQWLPTSEVDILCLQELKLKDEAFPEAALKAIGYESVWHGQPTYNGVALLFRPERTGMATEVVRNNPLFPDPQSRLIEAVFTPPGATRPLRVVCGYMPNGSEVGSEKYAYKLAWFEALTRWLAQQAPITPDWLLAGDFNIAPTDEDVHDPVAWAGKLHCSEPERLAFQRLLALGTHDAFRLFAQEPRQFSWWDYRQLGFRRNAGLRIDHLLVSEALRPRVLSCTIDKAPRRLEKPSDHTPVIATLAD